MSQAGVINVAGGGGGGTPIQSVTTDVRDNTRTLTPGTVLPSSNNISIVGGTTSQNSPITGIRTDANPNNGSLLYVELTNRLQSSSAGIGAGDTDFFTIDLGGAQMAGGAAGTYKMFCQVAVFESTTPAGAIFEITGGVRTTGSAGAATVIGVPDKLFDKEAALNNLDVNFVVSGNDFIVRVTNTTGLTPDVNIVLTYIFIN